LGIAEAPQILTAARDALGTEQTVRLDWRGAESVSSAVLQILLALEADLAAAGRRLEVSAAPESIQKTLEGCGLGRLAGARQPAHAESAGGK
jgi:anti-anti-sigma regulatory factor